jgi:hypothetical protein
MGEAYVHGLMNDWDALDRPDEASDENFVLV